jgi:preprotein translocase subunit SecA
VARDKALGLVETNVLEMLEENLGAEDPKEWNWQALVNQINTRWGLKVTDRQLKQMAKEAIGDYLRENASKVVADIDLNEGKPYLERDWGVQSLCDWARLKFQVKINPDELRDKSEPQVKKALLNAVMALYRQKEIDFPVTLAMAQFMSDKQQQPAAPGGQRYNREGLFQCAQARFPEAREQIKEDDFRTLSRNKLQELLQSISRSIYPSQGHEAVDQHLEDAFQGTRAAEAEDAREVAEWARTELKLDVTDQQLTGLTQPEARNLLWNAFDKLYRPEMKGMERGLLLNLLDSSWKNHLLQMEVLRSAMNLVWVGQIDAKTEYKREGMNEFNAMWKGIHDKVAETIFRMEETVEFQESMWQISAVRHDAAPRDSQNGSMSTNAGGEVKKIEPIRNRGEKVGRNDPCPCGSGKKYKNCHMRAEAV